MKTVSQLHYDLQLNILFFGRKRSADCQSISEFL